MTAHKLLFGKFRSNRDPAVQGIRDVLGLGARLSSFGRIGAVKMGTTARPAEVCGRRALIVTTPAGGGYGAV
ncbi:hypothetical protein [Rhizobium mongolense]|uniref:Uncharacterized protein n=1 Tax=Rhizobium mongolense TaxID=57676 RepID=A0ABR6ISL5_9HYPH|nr:hypothetical protein [Rhizobium mongolense]MBB4230882.1 hypothetical protein [Rhizobium mongolense]